MICKCGKYIRISTAIRSRVRTEPITITHTCGRDITITKEDVEEWTKKRMAKIRPKRGSK